MEIQSFNQGQEGRTRLGTHSDVFGLETMRHLLEDNEGNNTTSMSQQKDPNERSFQGTRPPVEHQEVE